MNTAFRKLGCRIRRGFTLIELVVVVLILGILAAVALPKFVNQTDNANKNGTLQSLSVLRTAIETYRANGTAYPTSAATLGTSLAPYLRGPFPAPAVGAGAGNNTVAASPGSPLTVVAGGAGWVYFPTTGEIGINDAAYISY